MSKKHALITLIIIIPFLVIIDSQIKIGQTSTTATVYINPPEVTNYTIGESFTINVTVANVSDLAVWEIQLYYYSSVLEAIEWEEGPFLKNVRATFCMTVAWNNNYNSTHGRIWLGCTLYYSGPGAYGSGTLATITFNVTGVGSCPLSLPLDQTKLWDSSFEPQPIPHDTIGGYVYVGGHDIAVLNLTPSKTIVGKGYPLFINVTAQNQGNFTETFNLTVYCNTTVIETQTITLADEESTTSTFTWNTTGFAYGNYTITAYASPVPDETGTEDNTFVDGVIHLTIPGDVDGDGDIDIYDVVKICSIYGVENGDLEYDANCDVNDDGKIDIYDVVIACSHYGEKV